MWWGKKMIILRGLWCLFCFYTVFKGNLESGAKLAAGWAGGGSGKRRCQSFIGVLASPGSGSSSGCIPGALCQPENNA